MRREIKGQVKCLAMSNLFKRIKQFVNKLIDDELEYYNFNDINNFGI